jgi:hypothetical protein
MNLTKLKNYAPAARTAFIEAVTRRAGVLGIKANQVDPVTESGDVALIGGQPFPRSVVPLRKELVDRNQLDGFATTMEAMAYTWFNRLVALRYMELHDGYLDHGYRVLSHPEGGSLPEILQHAEHVTFSGLNRDEVIRLKLAGDRDDELYRLLLLAQCQELHLILPSVFSRLDDATVLLLPDNLLHSDSVIRQLVAGSDEGDWEQVEVLGWIYQFYISDKKDTVMARKSAVPTEDIPAVTQLFTPHWIVRYLVENSLGRLWLLNRPNSRLRDHMPYYIEGEAETDFLKIAKPEEIKLLDPAVGSAHMLTYAFDLLYLIYEEEGYAATEIAGLILRHNLYGLDICPRAAQLAELALVFKAREKSRRFFTTQNFVRPNIIELRDVRFEEGELRDYIEALGLGDLFNQPMLKLLHQFEEAKNFGSLIQPCLDERLIGFARRAIEAKDLGGQLFLRETHLKVLRVLEQAEMLTQRYHVVVANPPYMGRKGMNASLAKFLDQEYPDGKSDLMAAFILRGFGLLREKAMFASVTLDSWMFLSSYIGLRATMIDGHRIDSLIHIGWNCFPEGHTYNRGVAFVMANQATPNNSGSYVNLSNVAAIIDKEVLFRERLQKNEIFRASGKDFERIPGKPISYWLSPALRNAFVPGHSVGDAFDVRQGVITGNNSLFLRYFWEVPRNTTALTNIELASGRRWFPLNKGGERRKWYGNHDYVIDWENDGRALRNYKDASGKLLSRPQNIQYFFKEGVTWPLITCAGFAARRMEKGFVFNVAGLTAFPRNGDGESLLCFLNSSIVSLLVSAINPTLNTNVGDVGNLPWTPEVLSKVKKKAEPIANESIFIARADWDNFETSWDFRDQPLLRPGLMGATLEASWRNWEAQSTAAIRRMQELETENNRLFIAAYGLEGELQPEVPEEQITLARADQRKDMAAFLSYALGCMMGRYSLDAPGLILANTGDSLSEYLAKVARSQDQLTFAPDADGIIPVLDGEWFDDDIVARTRDFLRATFGEATLAENVQFIEQSLGKDLRSYFLADFYKDHLQTYKSRPIYWLFSSGKQRAFQCLVYLHRYTPGTLARIRTEYVIPLQGKLGATIARLEEEVLQASTSSGRKKLQTDLDRAKKQMVELLAYDEQLRSYADQRIALDLDDGVKVNYAKFGDLVAEAKKICGKKED